MSCHVKGIKGSPTPAIPPPSPAQSTCPSSFFSQAFVFSVHLLHSISSSSPKPSATDTSLLLSLPHLLSQYYPLLKMFNFLLKKEARKILKRKDSDAGERGTMCTLHSSLFTIFEFHNASSFLLLTGFRVYRLLL